MKYLSQYNSLHFGPHMNMYVDLQSGVETELFWLLRGQRRTLASVSADRKACRLCWQATSPWLSSATWSACCSSTDDGPTCECASFSSTSSTRTSRSPCVTSGTPSTADSPLRSVYFIYFIYSSITQHVQPQSKICVYSYTSAL